MAFVNLSNLQTESTSKSISSSQGMNATELLDTIAGRLDDSECLERGRFDNSLHAHDPSLPASGEDGSDCIATTASEWAQNKDFRFLTQPNAIQDPFPDREDVAEEALNCDDVDEVAEEVPDCDGVDEVAEEAPDCDEVDEVTEKAKRLMEMDGIIPGVSAYGDFDGDDEDSVEAIRNRVAFEEPPQPEPEPEPELDQSTEPQLSRRVHTPRYSIYSHVNEVITRLRDSYPPHTNYGSRYTLRDFGGNGDCGPASIAGLINYHDRNGMYGQLMPGFNGGPRELRQYAVARIRERADLIATMAPFVVGIEVRGRDGDVIARDIEHYLQLMEQDGSYFDEPMFRLVADAMNMRIRIHRVSRNF